MFFSMTFLSFTGVFIAFAFFFLRYKRLHSIPGPPIASFTDLWRAYSQNVGNFQRKLCQLHDHYGPLVRVGPNNISVSDPAAISTIYSMHGEFKKADSYSPLRAFANGTVQGSIIDMQDEEKNTAMKRAVGGVFAVKNLLDYEHDVDEASAALIAKITAVRKFNLSKTLSEFQIDFLRKMAFSYPPSYLKEGKDITDMSATKRVRHWCRWQPTPGLEQLLYKNPYINKLLKRKTPLWILQAIQEWHGRKTSTQVREQKDLLDKYIEGSEKHKDTVSTETIQRLVASTISAGFDTTALTMTSIIYYLIKNPEAAGKLREEVDQAAAIGKLSDPAQYTETDKMEYLSAVIKEAMRCYPFITVLIERVVPAEGAMIAGKFIPGGTVVGCCPEVIHRNRELYGEDADRFRPERWLTEDRDRRIAMERASLGFGSGKRACMGRHIAELEMKKVIPDLLLKFKWSFDDPNAKLESSDGVTSIPRPIMVIFEEIS